MAATVEAVCRSDSHSMAKDPLPVIRLVAGLGVEGDAHSGKTVQHRSRVKHNPEQPNLRQVHLIHAELHEELSQQEFAISAGEMGENVTTRGVDLLALSTGTVLRLGPEAVIEVAGLRNPCRQLDGVSQGLMQATLEQDADGNLCRKAGVMAIVLEGGEVRPGDSIQVEPPPGEQRPLQPV